ncbi:MAG: enoyl-CoA hydratase/isomerase family protein [Bryobacteraceae bacterium]|nr:enoyl-CoA hydratase/isomerase family protein [Bryobacteraceae bacterium]
MSSSLLISREGRLLRLTLAREEKRNALNLELCRAIVEACEDPDPSVGAILLDAQGKVFSAGMDLAELRVQDPTVWHERLFTLGARLTKPLVAAINGPALAGGLGLVANAHIAIAAQGTSFGLTEIRLGLWPYVVYRGIVDAVGPRRARELSLTGRIFGPNEALQYGLIHEVVPAIELDDRATAVAQMLANWSPETLADGLTFAERSRSLSLTEGGALAAEMRAKTFSSPDFAEGLAAFESRRPPVWPSTSPQSSSSDPSPRIPHRSAS